MGYRYSFNGYEITDGISTNNSVIDFGARIYNSTIGKFFGIDPKFSEFEFLSPYCFAANNPIYFIDVLGEGPNEPSTYLSNHVALTQQIFESWVINQGYKKVPFSQDVGGYWKWSKVKGYILEQAFLEAYSAQRNTKVNSYGSIPDAIGDHTVKERHYGISKKGGKFKYDSDTYKGAIVYEVKSGMNIRFTKQMRSHMQAAYNAQDEDGDLAGEDDAAVLHIITLSGAVISNKLIQKAEKNNITIVWHVATYNPTTGEIGFSQGEIITDNCNEFLQKERNLLEAQNKVLIEMFDEQNPHLPDWEGAKRNAGVSNESTNPSDELEL